jgi:hypothetical protein
MVRLLSCIVLAIGLVQTPAPPSSETATQFYLRYQAVVPHATSMDEIIAFWAPEPANEYKAAPPDQRIDLAGLKSMYARVSNVTVTHEAVSGSAATAEATLSLEGIDKNQKKITGTAHLAKKDGQWRLLGPEQWQAPQ